MYVYQSVELLVLLTMADHENSNDLVLVENCLQKQKCICSLMYYIIGFKIFSAKELLCLK